MYQGALGDEIDAMVSHSRCETRRVQVWDNHNEMRRSRPRAAARVREESHIARICSVSVFVNGLQPGLLHLHWLVPLYVTRRRSRRARARLRKISPGRSTETTLYPDAIEANDAC
jgi:hypothetical protein